MNPWMVLASLAPLVLERIGRIRARVENKPYVTGDIKRLKPTWWPSSLSLDAKRSVSGIVIRIAGNFTLVNNGPVDTGISDVYMEITDRRKVYPRLECYPPHRIEEITIGPRRPWKSGHVEFERFIPEIDEPPKSLKCKFVVEAAGQGPFRKNLKLPAIARLPI